MNNDQLLIIDAFDAEPTLLLDLIRRLFNCREAQVDGGDVWIADPQSGHWLNIEGKAKIAEALRRVPEIFTSEVEVQ